MVSFNCKIFWKYNVFIFKQQAENGIRKILKDFYVILRIVLENSYFVHKQLDIQEADNFGVQKA